MSDTVNEQSDDGFESAQEYMEISDEHESDHTVGWRSGDVDEGTSSSLNESDEIEADAAISGSRPMQGRKRPAPRCRTMPPEDALNAIKQPASTSPAAHVTSRGSHSSIGLRTTTFHPTLGSLKKRRVQKVDGVPENQPRGNTGASASRNLVRRPTMTAHDNSSNVAAQPTNSVSRRSMASDAASTASFTFTFRPDASMAIPSLPLSMQGTSRDQFDDNLFLDAAPAQRSAVPAPSNIPSWNAERPFASVVRRGFTSASHASYSIHNLSTQGPVATDVSLVASTTSLQSIAGQSLGLAVSHGDVQTVRRGSRESQSGTVPADQMSVTTNCATHPTSPVNPPSPVTFPAFQRHETNPPSWSSQTADHTRNFSSGSLVLSSSSTSNASTTAQLMPNDSGQLPAQSIPTTGVRRMLSDLLTLREGEASLHAPRDDSDGVSERPSAWAQARRHEKSAARMPGSADHPTLSLELVERNTPGMGLSLPGLSSASAFCVPVTGTTSQITSDADIREARTREAIQMPVNGHRSGENKSTYRAMDQTLSGIRVSGSSSATDASRSIQSRSHGHAYYGGGPSRPQSATNAASTAMDVDKPRSEQLGYTPTIPAQEHLPSHPVVQHRTPEQQTTPTPLSNDTRDFRSQDDLYLEEDLMREMSIDESPSIVPSSIKWSHPHSPADVSQLRRAQKVSSSPIRPAQTSPARSFTATLDGRSHIHLARQPVAFQSHVTQSSSPPIFESSSSRGPLEQSRWTHLQREAAYDPTSTSSWTSPGQPPLPESRSNENSSMAATRDDLRQLTAAVSNLTQELRRFFKKTASSPNVPRAVARGTMEDMEDDGGEDGDDESDILRPTITHRRKKGFIKHRSSAHNQLAEDVREHARQLMRREAPDSLIDDGCVASPGEIQAWDGHSRCCSVLDFRLDLTATASSGWNRSATKVFVRDFIATGVFQCQDNKLIAAAFKSHFKSLKTHYERQLQTPEDEAVRVRQHARDQRRQTLFQRRLKIAVRTPQLRKHVDMLRSLGPDGMSSDEPDQFDLEQGVRQYRVSIMRWRNPLLRSWLRVFDSTSLFSKYYMQENGRGAYPRMRTLILPSSARPQDYSHRRPVPGLPANAYSSEWLQQLHPVEADDLDQRPDYDFSHDQEMMLLSQSTNMPAQSGLTGHQSSMRMSRNSYHNQGHQ